MKKKKTPKQIAALVAVVLLLSMYVITFIVACVAPVDTGNLFGACLFATMAIPLLAWIYIWIYGQMTGKKTIADLNWLQDPEERVAEEKEEIEE